MNTEQQLLLEWIVQRIKAFSPSYFEIKRLLLEGFGDQGAFTEWDGTTLFPSTEAERRAKLSQVRKGKIRPLFIATMKDESFYLRSMGPRGSGLRTRYSYSIAQDGTLTVQEESSAIMA